MRLSIFTPTHDPSFLPKVYESIKDQPFDEWLVLCNNGACYKNADKRVRTVYDSTGLDHVGYLKRAACAAASGEILVELDHDDMLLPNCIAELREAFSDNSVGFVYSNTVQATAEMKPVERFSTSFGWQYRKWNDLDELIAFEPTPQAVGRIWYAPNHVRAFRRTDYEAIGGYDPKMRVLDDQDLMCRLYQRTRFKHIDKPLYLYRVTGQNTWLKHNSEIQSNVNRLHDKYIEDLAGKWASDRGLRKLELGGRFAAKAGFETVDLKDAEVITDLDKRWPFEDGSVGVVRAYDIFEHLRDNLHTMKELYRVLAAGAYAFVQVPSTDGRGAFQDPTHRSFWNQNSFLYYTDRRWAAYIDSPVRFQAMRLYTTDKDGNGVCWTRAHLVKIGDGVRMPGEIGI